MPEMPNLNTQMIVGAYVGTDEVVALAMGSEIVWTSSPWEGLEISPRSVSLSNESSATTVSVKSSEYWQITTPAWLTATPSTGDSGTTQVLLEADATSTASTSGYVEAVSNNFSASASVGYEYVEPWIGLVVSPTAVSFSNTGVSSATLTISASSEWTSYAPAWVSVSPSTGTTGLTSVVLTMDTTYSASTTGQTNFDLDGLALTESVDIDYTYVAPPVVNFVDAVRWDGAPYWDLDYCLDTGVYFNQGTTIRFKYIGAGVFSDRIVGFDATECGSDDEDFRFFPDMFDAGNVRLSVPTSYYDEEVEQDITIGETYAYDNKSQYEICSTTPGGIISTATTIRIDMSTNWMEEVIIYENNVAVFDGKAAEVNGEYGMYDVVSNTFITSTAFTITEYTAPVPLSATTVALSVDPSVASAITLNFYKMHNDDPIIGGEWVEDEVLGTFDFDYHYYEPTPSESYWELASSSLTSAITSFVCPMGPWEGDELSVVSPLLDGNCDPDMSYAFKAVAHAFGGGMIKAKCKVNDSWDENICSNAELFIDYEDVSVFKTLTITYLPDFGQMHDMYDSWTVEITDNDKFSFYMNKYYDMGQMEWIEDVSFDNYDNPNVSYTLSGTNLIVNGDWDEYDGNGAGEYTLNMKFSTNNCTYDDETYVGGEAQLQFTGMSETIQFDEGNPICETYLIIDISSIPNDGNVHDYKVMNSDSEPLVVLNIDTSDWSYETIDDLDEYGYGFYTYEFDDQGDLSQGYARWKIKGQFIGTYYIYVDSIQLQSEPDYDDSEMVAFVNTDTDTMDTYSCYGEWDCVENNPGCIWNPNTGECECGPFE